MVDEYSFSRWLENELKNKGITQRELSRMSGISQHSISCYIARGYSPRLCNLNDILNALGKKIVIVDADS